MKRILTIAFVVTFVFTSSFGQPDTKMGNLKEKYVAFLVGANNYSNYNDLKYPVQDITALKETLKGYSFSDENIILVPNPTEQDFMQKANKLKERVNKIDNLLVYISVHGILNESGKYFWLPVDAKHEKISTKEWIFVRDFLNIIDEIDCKHVLLIIDSCYGGSLFTSINYKSGGGGGNRADAVITQSTIKEYKEKRSALAITSGTSQNTVPDDSHFFRAFNDVLKENKYEYFPINRLFENTRDEIYAIQGRSNFHGITVEPQLSKVNYLKDYGGQFVFYKPGGMKRLANTDSVGSGGGSDDNPSGTHRFKVENTIYKENINLNAGDRVEIIASGTITVGQFLGNVTPRGRVAGLFGLSIEQYNIVPKFPHGSLMYRIAPSQSWVLCGEGCEIRATKSGNMTIEFTINDNNTGDNSGNFDITMRKL